MHCHLLVLGIDLMKIKFDTNIFMLTVNILALFFCLVLVNDIFKSKDVCASCIKIPSIIQHVVAQPSGGVSTYCNGSGTLCGYSPGWSGFGALAAPGTVVNVAFLTTIGFGNLDNNDDGWVEIIGPSCNFGSNGLPNWCWWNVNCEASRYIGESNSATAAGGALGWNQ